MQAVYTLWQDAVSYVTRLHRWVQFILTDRGRGQFGDKAPQVSAVYTIWQSTLSVMWQGSTGECSLYSVTGDTISHMMRLCRWVQSILCSDRWHYLSYIRASQLSAVYSLWQVTLSVIHDWVQCLLCTDRCHCQSCDMQLDMIYCLKILVITLLTIPSISGGSLFYILKGRSISLGLFVDKMSWLAGSWQADAPWQASVPLAGVTQEVCRWPLSVCRDSYKNGYGYLCHCSYKCQPARDD